MTLVTLATLVTLVTHGTCEFYFIIIVPFVGRPQRFHLDVADADRRWQTFHPVITVKPSNYRRFVEQEQLLAIAVHMRRSDCWRVAVTRK